MDFLRNNSMGLTQMGLGLLSGKTGTEQAALGAQGLAGALQNNKTVAWLQKTNPELAEAVKSGVISGGDAYKMMVQQQIEAKKPRNHFMAVGKNLYDTDKGTWISPPAGVGGDDAEYGLNPQYGVDANGNPVILQLSKSGTSKQTALPDGVTLSKQPIKLDAGTHYVLLDPITRQPVGQVPKDLSGAETQKGEGKALADAREALPQVEDNARELLSAIDSLDKDPYLNSMVGAVDSWRPNLSSSAARVQSKMDQIGGQSFLQAFDKLRGAGQITEVEGAKATAAMARLNAAQNEQDYRAALAELRGVVQRALETARRRAAGGTSPAGGATSTGTRTTSGIQWSVEP
jgi:hypothetical protein